MVDQVKEKFGGLRFYVSNDNDEIKSLIYEAEYFVGGVGDFGQDDDPSVIDHNDPPKNQPGLWCQWVPSADGGGIEWNGGEKFYYYVEWLNYIIKNFLIPWGLVLNGTVKWRGEDFDDAGKILVKDNVVSKVTY